MPPLSAQSIDGFLALVPSAPQAAIDELAAACTTDLEPLRAALSRTEYARRRPSRLSPNQRQYLDTWGYPYVFEEYRWHMTLTDRVTGQFADDLRRQLNEMYRRMCDRAHATIDSLSLVRQKSPDAQFQLVERYPLAPSTS